MTLDDVADALGTRAVTGADIDALFDALETAGVQVASPDPVDLPAELGQVLASARALKAELARAPLVAEIAARSGLESGAVHRALVYARVLSR